MKETDRAALCAAYAFGMAGIGFTLPYLGVYLHQRGLADDTIGFISTAAAFAGLVQFPLALRPTRVGQRKRLLVAVLALLAAATWLLPHAHGAALLGWAVALFAENGACRASVESLSGALAVELGGAEGVGSVLASLRRWKPLAVVAMALCGGALAERRGVAAALEPVLWAQVFAVVCACKIREPLAPAAPTSVQTEPSATLRDPALWWFVLAMVLFHVANAAPGVYLGLFLVRDLHAPISTLSYAFICSNVVGMLAIGPAGRGSDRLGRRPLLLLGWTLMTLRLAALAVAQSGVQVLFVQVLDGAAQAIFSVVAAAWMTDRLGREQAGRAQVLVGCSLVFGSALGPSLCGLLWVGAGYRMMFTWLAVVGTLATLLLLAVPETRPAASRAPLPLTT